MSERDSLTILASGEGTYQLVIELLGLFQMDFGSLKLLLQLLSNRLALGKLIRQILGL